MTHEEKVEWYALIHKQNLNGRETEDELFEIGISAGIEETEKLNDEFAIEFFNWMRKNDTEENAEKFFGFSDVDMLNFFKKEKNYDNRSKN